MIDLQKTRPNVTLWCSFRCRGNPAKYQVNYEDEGPRMIYLCEPCLVIFEREGPNAERAVNSEQD